MTTQVPLISPRYTSPLTASGTVNAAGLVYTYEAETSTPKATYTDSAGGTANANPVVLDASGQATIWGTGAYKVVVKTSGGTTITTDDNYTAFQTTSTLDGLSDVLYDITTDNNLIIGRNTALTAGAKFNVFIGQEAGSTASTSATDWNTCIGYQAGKAITSSSVNTFIGATAGLVNTTGTGSVAVGYAALLANISGNSATAIGRNSLNATTGSNNSGLGNSSGTTNTSGTLNTFLGASSNANSATLTNATAVGATSLVLASNTVQLGDSSVTSVVCGTGNTASIRALNSAKFYGCVAVSGGTPTLEESFNITSIADTGTGQLTVTIATDMANATYTVVTSAELTATSYAVANDRKTYVRYATQAVGTFDIDCIDSTATTNVVKDPETWYFVGYGKH